MGNPKITQRPGGDVTYIIRVGAENVKRQPAREFSATEVLTNGRKGAMLIENKSYKPTKNMGKITFC